MGHDRSVDETGAEAVLVGRAPVARLMKLAAREAMSGIPQAVLLVGEEGAGKSALAEQLLGGLSMERLLRSAGEPGVSRPFDALPGSLVGRPSPGGPDESRVSRTIFDLLQSPVGRPTVLFVDAMELADSTSVAWLHGLIGRLEMADGARLLIVLAGRPGGWAEVDGAGSERRSVVELRPIAEDAVHELLHLLGVREPSVELTRAVIDRVGALPGRINELVHRHGANPGDLHAALETGPSAWSADGAEPAIRIAAELGSTVDIDRLVDVTGTPPVDIELAVDRATSAGLLMEGEPWPVFRDPVVRRACAAGLGARQRRRVHLEAAVRLDRLDEPGCGLDIGLHLIRAAPLRHGDLVERRLAEAGRIAHRLGAWRLARDLLEAAAYVHPDDLELATLLGEVTYHDHDLPVAQRILTGVLDHPDRADTTSRVRAAAILLRSELSHGGAPLGRHLAVDVLEEALEHPGELGGAQRSEATALLAEVAFAEGRNDDAAKLASDAWLAAPPTAARELARARFAGGLAALGRLDVGTARESFEACRELAAQANDEWTETWGVNRLPLVATLTGDVDDGLAATATARELTRATGDWSEHSFAWAMEANLHLLAGRFDDVEEAAEAAISGVSRSQYAWTPTFAFLSLTTSRIATGDLRGAQRTAEIAEAHDELVATGCHWLVTSARRLLGDTVEGPPITRVRPRDVGMIELSLMALEGRSGQMPGSICSIQCWPTTSTGCRTTSGAPRDLACRWVDSRRRTPRPADVGTGCSERSSSSRTSHSNGLASWSS